MLHLVLQTLFRRLLTAVPTMLVVSAVVFVILRVIPSDPIAMMLPPGATAADAAALRAAFGLDLPLPQQFAIWLGHALTGNLGQSIFFRESVIGLLARAFPTTAELS